MTMKTLKFKTNVSCGNCIAKITPHLNQLPGIDQWSVDTTTPMKILTVETADITPHAIINALKEAGYRGEVME